MPQIFQIFIQKSLYFQFFGAFLKICTNSSEILPQNFNLMYGNNYGRSDYQRRGSNRRSETSSTVQPVPRHSGTGQRELLLNRRALDVVLFLLQSSHSQNPASGSGEHMATGFIISSHLVITLFPMSLKCARCQILFQHFAAWFYEVANTVKNSRLYD